MIDHRKYWFNAVIIIGFLLISAGCRSMPAPVRDTPSSVKLSPPTFSTLEVSTTITPIFTPTNPVEASPTARSSYTPTLEIKNSTTPSITPSLTTTAMPIEYSTEVYPESLFSNSLAQLVLKTEEIPRNGDYPSFFYEGVITENNRTDELGAICGLDCIKMVWAHRYSQNGQVEFTLIMNRVRSSRAAATAVESVWADFSNAYSKSHFESGEQYISLHLPANSRLGIAIEPMGWYLDINIFFTASRGSVFLLVVDHFQSHEFVLDHEYKIIQNLVILQFDKLIAAGYPGD